MNVTHNDYGNIDVAHLLGMHQVMLGDTRRLESYAKAIKDRVRPGHVIADVGTGTGILAIIAAKAGAALVFAIEANPIMFKMAQHMIDQNNLRGRVVPIFGDASHLKLPLKVDGVISEMIGNVGPEEGMTRVLSSFLNNNLKPSGFVIPSKLETRMAPVQYQRELSDVWRIRDEGDFRLPPNLGRRGAALHFFSRKPLFLSDDHIVYSWDASVRQCDPVWHQNFVVSRPGTLQGVLMFFKARLSSSIELTNFPPYGGCNWATWNWLVDEEPVHPGQHLRITVDTKNLHPDVLEWWASLSVEDRLEAESR